MDISGTFVNMLYLLKGFIGSLKILPIDLKVFILGNIKISTDLVAKNTPAY
jgi:hypothetical protein